MKTWTESWTHAIAATVMVAAGMTVGCAAGESGNQSGGARAARSLLGVTGTAIDRVLGMETPAADWKILWGLPGTLGSSTTAIQGSSSLSLQPPGYTPLQSTQLSSLGSRVGTALQMDVQFQGTQVGSWWGSLTIGVDIPSLGVQSGGNGVIVNSYDLTNNLSAGWNTLSFPVPAAVQTALAGTYNDLQFTIIVNAASGTTGTYLIDNLRFLGGTTPPAPGPDGGVDGGQGCTVPAAPANVFVAPEDGIVGIAWSEATGAESYKILRTDNSGTSVTYTATGTSYADTSVTNGTTYTYTVTAVNACGESGNYGGVTATPMAKTKITLYYPRGVSRDQVVVAATNALSLNDRNKVLDADGNPGAVSNAGSGTAALTYSTVLGAYSSTGSVTSVGSVFLRSFGMVEGRLRTGSTLTKQNGAETIEDPQENVTLTPLTEFSWNVQIPHETQSPVMIEIGQQRTLPPGSYASITAKQDATLRLSSGTYFLGALDLEPWAKIHVDKSAGPIEIYVTGNVILRGDWIDDGGPEGDLLLVCLGTEGVTVEQVFKGSIVVPNAKLTLASRSVPYRGTFYGKEVESHQDNVLQALPFGWDRECVRFGCLAPDLCHSAAVCDTQTRKCGEAPATQCTAQGTCRDVGVCDLDTGICSDPPLNKVGCNISLRMDGVVEKGDGSGNLIAIFGYDSTGTKAARPAMNKVLIDGAEVPIPDPPPPAYLQPGSHPGAFLATFAPGHKITWRVEDPQYDISAEGPATLTAVPVGSGTSVDIGGGVKVPITPDMTPFQTHPSDPTTETGPAYSKRFNGVLSGHLAIEPSGAARYTVPIAIPPGTAGMAPNLSLVYNSQGMNGIAGQGWSLAGLSIIHRCPKTRLADGYVKPVELDGTSVGDEDADGVCLDGKRLFIKEKNGEETLYETEFTEFATIKHVKHPSDYFIVITKSGERRDYGPPDGNYGHVDLPVSGVGDGPSSETVVWALSQVTDVWGNFFTIVYESNSLSSGLRVRKINYTGHAYRDKPTDAPYYEIKFGYEDRPDTRSIRFHFGVLPMTKRLKTITTPRGIYRLTYAAGGTEPDGLFPSRLTRIDYCSTTLSKEECVEPLVFDWVGGGYKWVAAPEFQLPSKEAGAAVKLLDLDGDGRPDFVEAKEGSPFRAWRNKGKATGTCVSGNMQCGTPGGCKDGCEWNGSDSGGSSWQPFADWTVPVSLARANGDAIGTTFADIDGDGIVDLITDNRSDTHAPEVYLNRIMEQGNSGWQIPNGLAGSDIVAVLASLPASANGSALEDANWRKLDLLTDKVIDMDGDGRADIVHFATSCIGTQTCQQNDPGPPYPSPEFAMFVLRNTANGWTYDPSFTIRRSGSTNVKFKIEDLNRDGLPDLSGTMHKLNTGNDSSGTVWKDTTLQFSATFEPYAQMDIDGDGQFDYVGRDGNGTLSVTYVAGLDWIRDLKLGGGTGSIWVPGDRNVSLSVQAKFPPPTVNLPEELFGKWWQELAGWFKLADVNADGLADAVVNHNVGGRLLVNDGKEWKDLDGFTNFAAADSEDRSNGHWIPTAEPIHLLAVSTWNADDTARPRPYVNSFVDLDGDGVVDLLQSVPYLWVSSSGASGREQVRRAWINRYRPPTIRGFPAGLASKTTVEYAVITSEAAQSSGVYSDSFTRTTSGDSASRYHMLPVRVVTSTVTDNGIRGATTETYQYKDLRLSATTHGELGFAKIVSTNSASRMRTTTTLSQAYPFIGLPKLVEVEHLDHGLVSSTDTTYVSQATGNSGDRSLFVYPSVITAKVRAPFSNDDTRADTLTTVTRNSYDVFGNATKVEVDTDNGSIEVYRRTVETTYGKDGSAREHDEERMGKATRIVTTSKRLVRGGQGDTVVDTVTHTTALQYGTVADRPTALPMIKKILEPGTGAPLELHSAYAYDDFGNNTVTTECASNFDACSPGAQYAGKPQEPMDPPFRTTSVSYDPSVFSVPPNEGLIQQLSYGAGRYPVRRTNAVGHSTMEAYEPLWGSMLQLTAVDGNTTCVRLDSLGRKVAEIVRCGSNSPLGTDYGYFYIYSYPAVIDTPAVVVTVVTPPTGSKTWTYADTLGRTVEVRTLGFDGKQARVLTDYDSLGRTARTSKPFFSGDTTYWSSTAYDWLGRPFTFTQDLAILDGTGKQTRPGKTVRTTIYNGNLISTQQTVSGRIRQTTETKNALGKLSLVLENGSQMSYTYDPEGNLKTTEDSAKNQISIHYDVRGRKDWSKDPDLGKWYYFYNGFGDLVRQVDSKGQATVMTYDGVGRMTSKTSSEGIVTWVYDATPGQSGKGRLSAVIGQPDEHLMKSCSDLAPSLIPSSVDTSGNRPIQWFSYGSFGELVESFECVDGEVFSTKYEYEPKTGRQSVVRYPDTDTENGRLAVKYNYSKLGFLHYVSDESSGNVYWRANAINAAGQVVDEMAGNGVQTFQWRNPATGWLMRSGSVSNADSFNLIQSEAHRFDEVGNLMGRWRTSPGDTWDSNETFTYDSSDRLRTAEVRIADSAYASSESFVFDNLGNLTRKNQKTYSYSGCAAGGGPHSVCSVGGDAPYSYDANGNMVNGRGRDIAYNTANKVVKISKSTPQGADAYIARFSYSGSGSRIVQSVASGAGEELARTVYVGMDVNGKSMYERTTRHAGTTGSETGLQEVDHVHFIYAGAAHGGNALAIKLIREGGSSASTLTKYNHFDHLGSIVAVSDDQGKIRGQSWNGPKASVMGYDAWGLRRNADYSVGPTETFELPTGHRGFTGHETIPGVGLINMNGRVYDPELARFISPDSTIQFLANPQSYNRYSYVLNNPLRYTDPTGHDAVETVFGIAIGAIAMVACAASYGAACVVYMAAGVLFTTATMINHGADPGQAIFIAAVSTYAGFVTGGAARAVGSSLMGQIVAGAAAGAASSAAATAIGGGENLGANVLLGAVRGAVAAAMGYAVREAMVSQRGVPEGATCGSRCMDTMRKALIEDPSLANKTGWDLIELTGERGGDEYGAYSAGRPIARFRSVVEKLQPIFDHATESVPRRASAYNVASTKLYIGGSQSHSIDFGVIQLATPGSDPGDSFFRTGLSVLHELGHQYQMAQWAGWGLFKDIWDNQLAKAGGNIGKLYSTPHTFEWGADQFRDRYSGMLFR